MFVFLVCFVSGGSDASGILILFLMWFYCQPTVQVLSPPKPPPRASNGGMENIIQGLANIQLGERERQILGERNAIINGVRPAAVAAQGQAPLDAIGGGLVLKKSPPLPLPLPKEVIVISSDEENANANANSNARGRGNAHAHAHVPGQAPAAVRLTKASRLSKLARAIEDTFDGPGLARLMKEFMDVLQESRSRNVTREGFRVLEALRRQMCDPEVVVVAEAEAEAPAHAQAHRLRSRDWSGGAAGGGGESEGGARYSKMNRLFALKRAVDQAGTREALGKLLKEFEECIEGSAGKTVTKDGFGFLEAFAGKLRTITT